MGSFPHSRIHSLTHALAHSQLSDHYGLCVDLTVTQDDSDGAELGSDIAKHALLMNSRLPNSATPRQWSTGHTALEATRQALWLGPRALGLW